MGASLREIFYQRRHSAPVLGPLGSIAVSREDAGRLKAVIALFRNRNRSTVLHETGHLWLEELHADGALPDAPQQLKADLATVRAYLGAVGDAPLTVEQHEKWARTVEAYFMKGKAPSAALADVLARFKQWLVAIYRTARRLNIEISDDVRGVFDRMMATDEAQAEVHARPLFASAIQASMTEAEYQAYAESIAGARDRAVQTMLEAELRALARQAGGEPTPYALAHDWARRTIAGKTTAEIGDLEAYTRAESRAGLAAEAALAEGDIDATLRHKHEQMIAHALWREAYRAREHLAAAQSGQSLPDDIVAKTAARTNIPEARIREIVATPKPHRPDPRTYLSEEAIQAHLNPFRETGAVRIFSSQNVERKRAGSCRRFHRHRRAGSGRRLAGDSPIYRNQVWVRRNAMKLIYDKKVYPTPVRHENDENNIWGTHWHAERRGSIYTLRYLPGALIDREREIEITAAEFDILREAPERLNEIIFKHGG